MNVVGRVGSLISQGVYSVATPFHPFGGAVDIIVVQQQDGSFRTTPWYVRFGKFQGVLKGAEKIVTIAVNGEEAIFHMFLDNSGEAYFVREVVNGKDSESNGILKASDRLDSGISVDKNDCYSEASVNLSRLESSVSDSALVQSQDETNSLNYDADRLERAESDAERKFYDFQDEPSPSPREDSLEFSEYESNSYESLDGGVENILEPQGLDSEVVLVCVDGHVLMAPISASEGNTENMRLSIPQFHLGPGEETDFVEGSTDFVANEYSWENYVREIDVASTNVDSNNVGNAESFSCNPFEHKLKVPVKEETQYVQDEETSPLRNSSPEDCSSGIKRRDVFKSCLELPDLHVQEEVEDLLEKSPCSHSSVDVHEHGDAMDPIENHGLSPLSTEFPCRASSSDLPMEDDLMKNIVLGTEHLDSESVRAQYSDEPQCKDEEITISSQRSKSEDECHKGETVGRQPEVSMEENPTDPSKSSMEENPTDPSKSSMEENPTDPSRRFEISLCGSELHEGMGLGAAGAAFDSHIISEEEFKTSAESIMKNGNLIVRYKGRYLSWEKAAHFVLGTAAFGLDLPVEPKDTVQVEHYETPKLKEGDDSGIGTPTLAQRWRLWPIPFRRVKTIEHTSSSLSNEEVFVDSESGSQHPHVEPAGTSEALPNGSPHKQLMRTNIPTSEQISSLNLKDGQNIVTFNFSTRVFGKQQVDAHIYLWKWNARIVISDVDGTITKSDVLGQFMPLVGKDWTQSGVTRLFNAIKENGYQLLFLSARAIVQAYLTRSYLKNLKQDGNALPNGPVVISPDGLFPSLFREVIRRAPHEFKIACLEDIRALFPSDYNPFYAGFGNRDTDELSYRKMGIPKGKIFIINPKGEVAISHRIDVKSYTSLHTLVNDMFPPTSLVEQEDYNSWNYWRMPIPDIE